MDISTGGVLVAVMHKKDAEKWDLHSKDRIKIKAKDAVETVITDMTFSEHIIKPGTIGVFKEVAKNLGVKNGQTVEVQMARKPRSIELIKKKLDGKKLTREEYHQIIWDIVHHKITDIELTYFVAACYSNPLTDKETVDLIHAMTHEGDILKVEGKPVMDKHCIGGVAGNRTSMLIVPILAAAGCWIPKTSSRSITSPAGTADTMEVLCDVCVEKERMEKFVEKLHGCLVWGGALNLAPADDVIINVEKPLVIDAQSQLIASIISKKLSVSSTHILIDIPVGKGAKIESMYAAKNLKKAFEKLQRSLGVKIKAIITDGSAPIGNGIGPSLEARDVLWVLENNPHQPLDLREKGIMMAGTLLEMAGKARRNKGKDLARHILDSGMAAVKFREIIHAQGKRVDRPKDVPMGKYSEVITAPRSGTVTHIDNAIVSKIARVAGAPASAVAGMYIIKHKGNHVTKGMPLFKVYAGAKDRLKHAIEVIEHEFPYIIE